MSVQYAPSESEQMLAIKRAVASVVWPAGKPTMSRIGWSGYSAAALAPKPMSESAANAQRAIHLAGVCMVSPCIRMTRLFGSAATYTIHPARYTYSLP